MSVRTKRVPEKRLPSVSGLIPRETEAELKEILARRRVKAAPVREEATLPAGLRAPGLAPDTVSVTTTDDDPFVSPLRNAERPLDDFTLDGQGRPVGLEGPRVKIQLSKVITQMDEASFTFTPYVVNSYVPARPNTRGDFDFKSDDPFPVYSELQDASGRPLRNAEGLRIWSTGPAFAVQSTAFDSLNELWHRVSEWAGREIDWGKNGQLTFNPFAFIGFNAFYDPVTRELSSGMQSMQLEGENQTRMFVVASSKNVNKHEGGHALHDGLKPNHKVLDPGFRQWGESFGDQADLFTSLMDPTRVAAVLRQTQGDLSRPNAATGIGEALGKLWGTGAPIREAVNNAQFSSNHQEEHDASEALTGAAYSIFLKIYKMELASGRTAESAVMTAANTMGLFMVRPADFTPENTLTLEDVVKGYLTVDEELFGGKYQQLLVSEFERRRLLKPNGSSVQSWRDHRASLPSLTLSPSASAADIQQLVAQSQDALGLGPSFGARVQSVETTSDGFRIVRLQLTQGRDRRAFPVANHGSLVFRPDGTLADFYSPMPQGLLDRDAIAAIDRASQAAWRSHGELEFVKDESNHWKTQVAVPVTQKDRPGGHFMVYDLDHPEGQRVDYLDLRRRDDWAHNPDTLTVKRSAN